MSRVLFSCEYPLYTVGVLRDAEFYVAGGGGQAKTGVPNALEIHRLTWEGSSYVSVPIHQHGMGTSLIMNCARHPKLQSLAAGVGGECCVLEINRNEEEGKGEGGGEEGKGEGGGQEGKGEGGGEEEWKGEEKKTSTVRKRTARGATEPNKEGSPTVVEGEAIFVQSMASMQTDFSKEPYQRVVRFTCEGVRVVTGGGDGVVRVWKYPSLQKVSEMSCHNNEIEDIACHPSQQQIVSVCRDGLAVIWDLDNYEKEREFTWSPWQQGKNATDKKSRYKFRACYFSQGVDHTSLYTLNTPLRWVSKEKQYCYLLKWDACTWEVEERRRTGRELLSALTVDSTGSYVGVGTVEGAVLIFSSDLELLSHVLAVHTVFVTGLAFLRVATAPDRLALISVSADRTCSATLVTKRSSSSMIIILFIILSLLVLIIIAMVTKHLALW